jgi:hypothetical protein
MKYSFYSQLFSSNVFILISLFTLISIILKPLSAEENNSFPTQDEANIIVNSNNNTSVDSAHRAVVNQVGVISRFIDSFFENPNYAAEEADARISLFQSTNITKRTSRTFRTRLKGSLTLPNLSRRLKLSFSGYDDLNIDETREENIEESAEESIKIPSIRLQYSLFDRNNIQIKESTGIRLRNPSLFAGFRFTIKRDLSKKWNTKYIQRVFWYTKDGWISSTELNFNRVIGKRNLFRETCKAFWQESHDLSEGFKFNLISSFSQPLAKSAILRYHWSSFYFTKPDARWSSTTFSIKFRQRVWRDWLTLELAPFITWNENVNWKSDIGSVVTIALIFEGEKLTPKPNIK